VLKTYTTNTRVHEERQKFGVFLWEIADRYGVSEATMYRILRKELPEETQNKIVQIIRDIVKERYDSKSA